jgi:hypothetical protein
MIGLLLSAALVVPKPHFAAVQTHHRVTSVVVKQGDTLSHIGSKFYMKWQAIYERNRSVVGSDPNVILPGMKLRIPVRPTVWAAKYTVPIRATVVDDPTPPPPSPGPIGQEPQPLPFPAQTQGYGAFETCVIQHESGGNPLAYNPASGAGGLFQFLPSTWASLGLGYPGGAQTAPVAVQDEGFNILYARDGTSPWAPYDGC